MGVQQVGCLINSRVIDVKFRNVHVLDNSVIKHSLRKYSFELMINGFIMLLAVKF